MLIPKNFIVVVAVAAVIVVGALLATGVWNPSWNPLQKKQVGIGVVEESLGNLLNLKSFKIESNLRADVAETIEEEGRKGAQKGTIVVGFIGTRDASEPDNLKTSANFDVKIILEGAQFSFGGDLKTFGENIYFKINTLPPLFFLMDDLEAIKNQWIKIDVRKLRELAGKSTIEPPNEKAIKELMRDFPALLKGRRMFEIKKDLGQENLNGEMVRHYLVALNKEAVKEFIPEFWRFAQKYMPQEQQDQYEASQKDFLEKFPQEFERAWQGLKDITLNIWTTKQPLLKRLRWEKEIDLIPFGGLKGQTRDERMNLVLEVNFSEFNKKFALEEPKEFKLFEDVLSQFSPFDELFEDATSSPFLPEEEGFEEVE